MYMYIYIHTYVHVCMCIYIYPYAEDMEPIPPMSLSLITGDAGGMGDASSVRSPLTSLLSSALAPPSSSPGALPKSPKSPLLVTSPGTG